MKQRLPKSVFSGESKDKSPSSMLIQAWLLQVRFYRFQSVSSEYVLRGRYRTSTFFRMNVVLE